MAQELDRLINKIREEGIQAAETKARQIEDAAGAEAERIIRQAKAQAAEAMADARGKIAAMELSSRASLEQTGRDFVIALKRELNELLHKVIEREARKALTPEELAGIITSLVKGCATKDRCDITITLKKEDLEKIEREFFSALKDEVKKGLELKTSADIHGGFIISYDGGKSYFDFTDKALGDYLASHLKPRLAKLFE